MSALFRRAVVFGVGLIGGSVAGAIRQRRLADEVIGVDPAGAAEALRLGLIDRVAAGGADALPGADLVVLAAPVAVNCELLRALGQRCAAGSVGSSDAALAPGAVITDVSSTKRSVVDAAARWLGTLAPRFVPAHPIAGSETSGPGAADPRLFDGRIALLCPGEGTAADAVERVDALWRGMGAVTSRMRADRHDDLLAAVSHWPHAVAFALSAAVGGGELADDARRFAGAGLRDTTRIGASSPELWAGILLDNRDPSLAAAVEFRRRLVEIEEALAAGDRARLVEALAVGARWRRSL